jgi:hypothetical protein
MRAPIVLCVSFAALVGCSSVPEIASSPNVSSAELSTYVREHWTDFQLRAAFLADRQGTRPELEGVEAAVCRPAGGDFACGFVARIRFPDGQTAKPDIDVNLRRESDGRLVQLIMVVREPG